MKIHIHTCSGAGVAIVALGLVYTVACASESKSDDGARAPFETTDSGSIAPNIGNDAGPTKSGLPSDCAEGADSVYTLDSSQHIYKFDPPSKQFTDLGALFCPATPGWKGDGASPFSMGVDRGLVAWVLYVSGELFKVDLKSKQLTCTKTAWVTPQTDELKELRNFGMGFSTDSVGGTTDTLFIAGAPLLAAPALAKISPSDPTLTPTFIAKETGVAEMTGNGNGELWGFFADPQTPHVVQFDKATGSRIKDFPEPAIARRAPGFAFAHWGGDYWVFIYERDQETTTVYQVDANNGALKSTTPNTGRLIVGAGVSTCAPVAVK